MKKILSLILLTIYGFSCTPSFAEDTSHTNETYFIVTAYYSPLPDQKNYITGNYEDEILLNGEGIRGASGKKVFPGMLAAPKTYSFGTKISLDGLGIGSVEDRGGAIVTAGQRGYSYDRIDVWMGYGDEGLNRALQWGKRKVLGTIVSSQSELTLDYSHIPSLGFVYTPKTQITQIPIIQQKQSIFDTPINGKSASSDISSLQNILEQLGYLEKESYKKGFFDTPTFQAILKIQLETSILKSEDELGAGNFGPKTRKEMKIMYDEYLKNEEEKRQLAAKKEKENIRIENEIKALIEEIGSPLYGDISPNVRKLQNALKEIGYFQSKDTAIFGPLTQNALIDFQIDTGIIKNQNDSSAGIYGPKTKSKLQEMLQEKRKSTTEENISSKDISLASVFMF